MVLKGWHRAQKVTDDRRRVLDAYVRELASTRTQRLLDLAPSKPGFWNVPELTKHEAGIEMVVRTFRGGSGAEDLQVVVSITGLRGLHRVFADGFVVRNSGRVEEMSDDDWAIWNI